MTLSLVFLAPDLVKAAIEGRLPRGFNRTRLVDPPMLWSEQWRAWALSRLRRGLRSGPDVNPNRNRPLQTASGWSLTRDEASW